MDLVESSPPSFENSKRLRQQARAAGMDPNYWYAVEEVHRIKEGSVLEVVFWKHSISDGAERHIGDGVPADSNKLPDVFAKVERFDPDRFASPRHKDKSSVDGIARSFRMRADVTLPEPNYGSWVTDPQKPSDLRSTR